ncbi:hypothetical protein KJB64_11645 [Staphylococcus cohnii]|uniref:hypothetical protein n=1 Tax=Staphylococcus cohnii TaxID=29382 RepID=UPI001F2C7FD6|nr:hypothetical protein [Staphylococcus cohnii]MCE5034939.1 hypothetical protein [Staphylococcus cohnii]
MTKTYFMRVYDIIIYLIIFTIFTAVLGKLFDILKIPLSEIEIIDMNKVILYITLISSFLYQLALCFIGLAILLISVDLIIRIFKDQLKNHIKSVYHTIVLRHYLKQDVDSHQDKSWHQKDAMKSNPVQRYFNKVMGKSLVDVHDNEVRIAIKIPRKQQAHEIFKTIENQIHEEITHLHPNYYFSTSQRHHRYQWFIGQKR